MFLQSFHSLSDEFNTFSVQGAEENTAGASQRAVTRATVA
jgi:hypothetical protein